MKSPTGHVSARHHHKDQTQLPIPGSQPRGFNSINNNSTAQNLNGKNKKRRGFEPTPPEKKPVKMNAAIAPSANGKWTCNKCGCPEALTPVKRIGPDGQRNICNACYIRGRAMKERGMRGSARPTAISAAALEGKTPISRSNNNNNLSPTRQLYATTAGNNIATSPNSAAAAQYWMQQSAAMFGMQMSPTQQYFNAVAPTAATTMMLYPATSSSGGNTSGFYASSPGSSPTSISAAGMASFLNYHNDNSVSSPDSPSPSSLHHRNNNNNNTSNNNMKSPTIMMSMGNDNGMINHQISPTASDADTGANFFDFHASSLMQLPSPDHVISPPIAASTTTRSTRRGQSTQR